MVLFVLARLFQCLKTCQCRLICRLYHTVCGMRFVLRHCARQWVLRRRVGTVSNDFLQGRNARRMPRKRLAKSAEMTSTDCVPCARGSSTNLPLVLQRSTRSDDFQRNVRVRELHVISDVSLTLRHACAKPLATCCFSPSQVNFCVADRAWTTPGCHVSSHPEVSPTETLRNCQESTPALFSERFRCA